MPTSRSSHLALLRRRKWFEKLTKLLNESKLVATYSIHNPVAVVKALTTLIFEGYSAFSRKLLRAQKRQRKYSSLHKNLQLKYIVHRFASLIKTLCFISLYAILNALSFCLYKLVAAVIPKISFPTLSKGNKLAIDGVSIIIPTWNKKMMVIHCLKRLDQILAHDSSLPPVEIIVIDNGSNDGTGPALGSLQIKVPLLVLTAGSNLGFARAINWGAKQAKYNYLYLLNNDMLPIPGFLTELLAFAQSLVARGRPFFGLSSQIFFYDPKKRREESGKTYYLPDFGYLSVAHCVHPDNLNVASLTAYPGGGSSLLNKELFLALRGYDYKLYRPLYDEDLDLGFTAWRLGFPSYYIPSSQVIHHHHASSAILHTDPREYMYKNWLTFILKHYDSFSLLCHHLVFYPIRMYIDPRFIRYAKANLKLLPLIFLKKLQLAQYRPIYESHELINFPRFEHKYHKKYL